MNFRTLGLNGGGLLLAVVVGVFIGRSTSGGPEESSTLGKDGIPAGLTNRMDRGASSRDSNDGNARRMRTSAGAEESSTPLERLQAVLNTPVQLQRTQKLLNFLDRLPDDEFAAVYEELKNSPSADIHNSERSLILQAWAERDPVAATAHLQEHGAEDWERETVLGTWASLDPEGAFAWATAAEDAGSVNNWVVGALRGAAAANPELARDLLQTLAQGETRWEALGRIQNHVTQFGYDYAEEWISGIDDPGLQNEAARRLADNLTELDPAKAGVWNASIADRETRRDVSETVSDSWARQDLDGARDWVDSLPEDTRTEAAEGVARHYARQDPAAAADWLAGMGNNPDLDGAKRVLIEETFHRSPEVSLGFVSNLSDQDIQLRSYHRYLGTWMREDPDTAHGWTEANASTLPPSVVKRFLP